MGSVKWRGCGPYETLAETAGLVMEMLDTLDTVTIAGQRYLMEKLVVVLGRDKVVPTMTLEVLAREAGRVVPDVRAFSSHVTALVEAALSQ
jgi:hypothetical protein